MAYQVNWYLGRRIIYAIIEDDYFSAKDLAGLNDMLVTFIRRSNAPHVHVIIDASAVKLLPFPGAQQPVFAYLREPQLGWNLLIASESATKYLNGLVAPLGAAQFHSFPSLEEGLFFLEDEDETLLMPA